jgi:hypothetical protein
MKTYKTLLLIFTLGLGACASDEDAVSSQFAEPHRFYAFATLEGVQHEVKAGENGYELFTQHSLSNQVLTSKTILAQDTAVLRNAWVINLRGQDTGLSSALREGDLPWRSATGFTQVPNEVRYTFWPEIDYGTSPSWSLNNGNRQRADTLNTAVINFKNTPQLEVALFTIANTNVPTVKYGLKTASTDMALMRLNADSTTNQLNGQIQARRGQVQNVYPASFSNAGGVAFNLNTLAFPLELEASVTFSSGFYQDIEKVLNSADFYGDQNILFERQPNWQANPLNENTVELIYYHEDGTAYYPIPGQGSFSLNRVMPYANTKALGDGAHKQVLFSGHGLLRSAIGNTLNLQQISGSFAFEYE